MVHVKSHEQCSLLKSTIPSLPVFMSFLVLPYVYLRTRSINYYYYYHYHFFLSSKRLDAIKNWLNLMWYLLLWRRVRERDCKLDWDKVEPLREKKNQGLKMYLHTYTKELSMFIAILFIVAKDWEKPKCPQQELLK